MSTSKDTVTLKLQIKKVLWITVLWVILGNMQIWYETSVLYSEDCIPAEFDISQVLFGTVVSTGLAGIIGGSAVVFLFGQWIRIWPYWRAIISILIGFTLVFMFVSFIGFMLVAGEYEVEYSLRGFTGYVGSLGFFRGYTSWFIIVMLTLFGLLVYDKYGPGTLHKLLLGSYFKPKTEERVFMFLDLRSSTAIAERLGEKQYFNLLHDVIRDVTAPILAAKGEIYQYVGDEIVISWPIKHARQNENCLKCFFDVRDAIHRKAKYYKAKYDLVPEYKAGLHYGNVVAGEIGVVKRDITYTGDVLNTTARIQSKCNELGVDILFSKRLLDLLNLAPGRYHPKRIGEIPLRGKARDELLYTV